MICVTCNSNPILADTANFWTLNDRGEDYTPSLGECTKVISKGIKFDHKTFSSLYIYDESQWHITMTEGVFVCKYLGKLREKDVDNLSFGDKFLHVQDACDVNDEWQQVCSNFLKKGKITGEDIDMCFKESPVFKEYGWITKKCVKANYPY